MADASVNDTESVTEPARQSKESTVGEGGDSKTSDSQQAGRSAEADRSKGQTASGEASLEDLLRSLQHGLKNSDWVKENTAEKWLAEHPDIADAFVNPSKGDVEKK